MIVDRFENLGLKPGYFVVFFPQDLHMPDCMVDKQEKARKLVVKIRV